MFEFWKSRNFEYDQIQGQNDDEESVKVHSNRKLNAPPGVRSGERRRVRELIWIAATCILAVYAVTLSYELWSRSKQPSFENGFTTDLQAAKSSIHLINRQFSGGLMIHSNGSWYREIDEAKLQYVGEPRRDLDDAWNELLAGMNIDLPANEAEDMRDKTWKWPETELYFTGVNVFHGLHCLNMVRKALSPEYYVWPHQSSGAEAFAKMHIEHCIDFIRQSLQCSADMSPMLWFWSSDHNNPILKPDTTHTCRDWDAIHEWAKEREIDPEAKKQFLGKASNDHDAHVEGR
ncbi:hypothetical protein BP5796_06838 [Coleophoma crateriformis]|uniref:Tat pathway signal sequence n=1 Tax=Coleophoma crateriformis TaxID=565419 RepID=A0A3D8RPL4_9HELO|nr:hypothetical protein BP5796_06838 [Coleophoma crateriformis]